MPGLRAFLPALAAFLLCACTPDSDRHEASIAAFGTIVQITTRHPDRGESERAVAAVDRELQAMHHRWHAWEPGPLTRVNEAIAAGSSLDLPQDMIEPIREAKRLESASLGLFNPAIGRLLRLWGFHASELPSGPPPPDAAIAELLAQSPSLGDLTVEKGTISSRNPAVQMDFGGFIKGVGVERALEILRSAGIRHAVVNAGGDVGVIGRRDEERWRAGIRHPDGRGGRILADLALSDGEFVFTSGNYLRYREHQGIRHGHIIDPRTGYPADQVVSVTVIDERGGRADAAATALAVASDAEWPRIAMSIGIDKVLRVDADGRVEMTPAMAERVRFLERPAAIAVQSLPRR